MKRKTLLGVVIFLAIIIGLVFIFRNVDYQILLGVIVGLIPSGVLWHLQKKKDEKDHRDWLLRNREAYLLEIVDILISSASMKESSEEKKLKNMLDRLKNFNSAILVWGSPSMLRAWNEMQQVPVGVGIKQATRNGERFLRKIRKELGHDDSKLKPGEVWATLLIPKDKQGALDACRNEVYK